VLNLQRTTRLAEFIFANGEIYVKSVGYVSKSSGLIYMHPDFPRSNHYEKCTTFPLRWDVHLIPVPEGGFIFHVQEKRTHKTYDLGVSSTDTIARLKERILDELDLPIVRLRSGIGNDFKWGGSSIGYEFQWCSIRRLSYSRRLQCNTGLNASISNDERIIAILPCR